MLDRTRLNETIHHVVALLVRGDYDGLERLSGGVRLSADDVREEVEEYGCTIVPLPPGTTDGIEVIAVDGTPPQEWAVCVDLYTAEGGRSDLSLEMTLIDRPGWLYAVELDNLHVT